MFALRRAYDPITDARFDIQVSRLNQSYAFAVYRAIETSQLDFRYHRGEFLVSHEDLVDQAGPGSDTTDPEGGCYIPDHAYLA